MRPSTTLPLPLPERPLPSSTAPEPALPATTRSVAPDPAADALGVLDDPQELARFTRFSTGPDGQAQAESALRITGMHCAACAGTIEQAVGRVAGVRAVQVSAAGERAQVLWLPGRTNMAALVQAVRGAGYDAAPDLAVTAREARQAEHRTALWRFFVAGFCAMQVMMMATPSYVATGDADFAPDLRQLLNWGSWLLTLPVMAFSAGPFLQGAWRSLRQRRMGMDVPVALGILVTFVTSTGATFEPGGLFGHEVYFDSLTMFVAFLLGGRLLETRARHRVAQVLESALSGMPETAWRIRADGQTEQVSVQRLAPGDLVRVPVGQAFPADGSVQAGCSQADESLLTGESTPVDKPLGAAVVAGSLNLAAPVDMRVDRLGNDTRLAGIVALMQQAMSQRPSWARLADRWATPFLWVVLLAAAGAAAVWSVIDPPRAVWVAVAVLIVTCPCALSLAAPSAMLAAASALARRGVLLHRLDALEVLTRVSTVYLDKTGTVTEDRLQALGVQRVPVDAAGVQPGLVFSDAELSGHAAGLAAWSSHPLSQSLKAQAEADGVAPSTAFQAVQELPGQGLQGRDGQGRLWRLGRADWVQAAVDSAASAQALALAAVPQARPQPALPQTLSQAALPQAIPQPALPPVPTLPGDEPAAATWLGCDGQLLARFGFDETVRGDALATVAALRAQGLKVVLLSGDAPERAGRMAQRLQVDAVVAGASPEDKLAEVAAAQARGEVVAMVGDGINDAPVLARADVSLAMGQGALVARAQADAVIVSNRLADLVQARQLARRTLRVVRQNMAWAAAYNAVCIPLALAGWLPPWAAGLGMALSSLLVIGNAARLAR